MQDGGITVQRNWRALIALSALLLMVVVSTAQAGAGQSPPLGMVVLTVDGRIETKNSGDVAEFDLAALESMMTQSVTVTDFAETGAGRHEFTGVSAVEVLASAGARGARVTAVALDGYERAFEIAELQKYGAILAYRKDGRYLRIDNREFGGRGPLWMIYPLDRHPELRQREDIAGRFVYQLVRLRVE